MTMPMRMTKTKMNTKIYQNNDNKVKFKSYDKKHRIKTLLKFTIHFIINIPSTNSMRQKAKICLKSKRKKANKQKLYKIKK